VAYDQNDDWPSYRPPPNNGEPEVSIERWKFDALLRGAFNRSMQTMAESVRNDDEGHDVRGEPSTLNVAPPDELPPRLAADDQPALTEPAIPPEVLAAIEQKIDELTERLDRFERMKEAEQALLDLEDEIERLSPPKEGGDDDLMLN
jgi:hypothetical protein